MVASQGSSDTPDIVEMFRDKDVTVREFVNAHFYEPMDRGVMDQENQEKLRA